MAILTRAVIAILILGAEGVMRVRATAKYGSTETVEDLYATDAGTGLRVPVRPDATSADGLLRP
jgi:hypothetical protein